MRASKHIPMAGAFLCALWLLTTVTLAEPLRVLCTTTQLGAATTAIGDNDVAVTTIIPFGVCPGHFDLSPRQAEKLRQADMVFFHGYERFLTTLAAGMPDMAVQRVEVAGNWMIPAVHRQGASVLTELLSAKRPERREQFAARLAQYLRDIDAAVAAQAPIVAALRDRPVLCAAMNSDVVADLGCAVAGVFPRDEELSAQRLAALISTGKKAHVSLVIDNLQSGGKGGATIARELGVPLVVLTNFPTSEGYPATLRQNAAALQAALTPAKAAP
ncbi:MAG: metal ABC transporter substrate-binding protein [Lentisphaeria bacterium]|jgi:zinc transport system substrate-binding protein